MHTFKHRTNEDFSFDSDALYQFGLKALNARDYKSAIIILQLAEDKGNKQAKILLYRIKKS